MLTRFLLLLLQVVVLVDQRSSLLILRNKCLPSSINLILQIMVSIVSIKNRDLRI